MNICLIGSTGHWNLAFEGIQDKGSNRIVGVSKGSPDETLTGVLDTCKQYRQTPKVFDDYREMLDSLKPDVALVACRFHDLAKKGVDVLERGIHLFIEKPMAITMNDMTRLREAHSRSGACLSAMLALRYQPAFLSAWEAVQTGAIGDVCLLTAQKSYKLGIRPDYYRKRETYGGTIPWVGSHSIDLLAWFAGVPFKTVFATHSTKGIHDHGECEAIALCLFTFANNIMGSTNIDYLRPATAPSHGDDRIRVAGNDGVIEVRDGQAFLINSKTEGIQTLVSKEKRNIFTEFLKQVKGEGTYLISAEDSFRMTEACLLARQSADEARLIQFGKIT